MYYRYTYTVGFLYISELDQGFQYKAMEFTCPNIYKIQQRELINILVPSPKTKFSLSNLYNINKYKTRLPSTVLYDTLTRNTDFRNIIPYTNSIYNLISTRCPGNPHIGFFVRVETFYIVYYFAV